MRNLFHKQSWDPYMDGIELRPRLYTWPEKIIFFFSLFLIVLSLLLLLLPIHTEGVAERSGEGFWLLTETKELDDSLSERTYKQGGERISVTGPFPLIDQTTYTERWDLVYQSENGRKRSLGIWSGEINSADAMRPISYHDGEEKISGNLLLTSGSLRRGQVGKFVSKDIDLYNPVFEMTNEGYNYYYTDYEALARMALGITFSRRAVMGRFLFYAIASAGLAALLTYFYNELFMIQRALMSFSYHHSDDLEPTGLFTFNHFIGTSLFAGISIVLLIMYFS